jgi:hypothetical protein
MRRRESSKSMWKCKRNRYEIIFKVKLNWNIHIFN